MNLKNGLKLLLVALSILILDFVSKGLINFYIQRVEHAPHFFPFGGVSVFQNFFGIDFCIHHVTNRGAAWGIGSGLQGLLLLVRIAVVVGLIVYLRISSKAQEYRYPLAMIIAGGLGNILDYFIYGHVIDMFHFFFWGYSYPIFNVADSSIFLGIVWLLFHSLRKKNVISQT
jgi:signal peptidase II